MQPVSLWNKSHFSFLEGASSPEELVATAIEQGHRALALTDRDGVSGLPQAWVAAREKELRLIHGAQVTVDDDSVIVLLAADRGGYANLTRLLTRGRLRSEKGSSRVTWGEVAEHAGGLLALWGGRDSLLDRTDPPTLPRIAGDLRDAFGDRLFALAARHLHAPEGRRERHLRERAGRFGLPVVAGVEVLYHHRARRPLQDVLTCIREGVTVPEAGTRLRPNDRHALPSPQLMRRLFADDPRALARTAEIAERCAFTLADLRYRYPAEHLPFGLSTARWLDQLVRRGARDRFGDTVPADLQQRIDRELALIHDLDYEGYFLTMYEIVRFCREQGIICQGRGSAANSVVCYCLKITAVNPREVDLLFERFISRERAEPPDIDLDIEHGRREEVIQHVYEKYGRDRAAMVANTVRFRPRSAIREVGKALGLPAVNLDRLAKLTGYRGELRADDLTAAGFDPAAPLHAHFARLVEQIQEFPRHLSIHPGGFLLGHEPVHDLVPVENATMPGRTVIQWDKHGVEALGLFKVDLLGLGALNQLHRAFDLLREHRGLDLSLARIPRDDRPTFEMLHRADSVGTFQVESRAQMNMLPRLRPETYYDLVIQVAIIRPGPITGGMVHPYIARRHGREPVVYPHPSLEPILRKTLGVPLFQEQVMRVAMVAGGYTPGEADQLRRDMATWRRHGPIESHREKLVGGMVARGIEPEFAERVFQQIKGFGEYGFPESHAASFALIAYATSWLKCHHPDVFACSLLNAQPMGFYSAGTIVEDARRHGIVVHPVDVNASDWDCTLECVGSGVTRPCGSALRPSGLLGPAGRFASRTGDTTPNAPPGTIPDARIDDSMNGDTGPVRDTPNGTGGDGSLVGAAPSDGASHLVGVVRGGSGDSARRAERARRAKRGAEHASHDTDQAGRAAVRMGLRYVRGLSREVAERIVIGRPWDSIGQLYREARVPVDMLVALAEAGALATFEPDRRRALWAVHGLSRRDRPEQLVLPLPEAGPAPRLRELSELEVINWDWRTGGHSPRAHLLEPLRGTLQQRGWPTAEEINAIPHGRRAEYVGLVICRQRPATASGVTFMTLEDETGFVNLVVWQQVYERFRLLAKTLSLMGVSGKIQSEEGVVHLVVDGIWKPRLDREPVPAASRDFH